MNYMQTFTYLRATLTMRAARLRASLREGERGASAVELAIITAVILGIAVALLAVISTFVKTESGKITSNTP